MAFICILEEDLWAFIHPFDGLSMAPQDSDGPSGAERAKEPRCFAGLEAQIRYNDHFLFLFSFFAPHWFAGC